MAKTSFLVNRPKPELTAISHSSSGFDQVDRRSHEQGLPGNHVTCGGGFPAYCHRFAEVEADKG